MWKPSIRPYWGGIRHQRKSMGGRRRSCIVQDGVPQFLDCHNSTPVPSCQDQAAVTCWWGGSITGSSTGGQRQELAWWTQDIATWCAVQGAVEVFFNSLEQLSVRHAADHVTGSPGTLGPRAACGGPGVVGGRSAGQPARLKTTSWRAPSSRPVSIASSPRRMWPTAAVRNPPPP